VEDDIEEEVPNCSKELKKNWPYDNKKQMNYI
jgi:hypothetical protein